MPKTLNLDNLTQPPETEGNPWSTLLFDTAHGGIGATAAHAAITSLLPAWQDDGGANREYLLHTLEDTIKALSQYYWGLKVAFQHEALNEATAALALRALVAGDLTRADTDLLGAKVEALSDLKKTCGLEEVTPALIASAFAPTAKEEAGAA